MQVIWFFFIFLIQSAFAVGPLETKINQFDELQQLLQRYCINNPNKANVKVLVNRTELSCNQLLALSARLRSQIEDNVDDIEEECSNPRTEPETLARQTAQAAAQSVCRPVSTDAQCMGSFICSLGSQIGKSIPIFGAPISGMMRSCAGKYSAGGCIQNIAKGIFDSLWGLISSVWDIGKAAVRGIGEWMGIIEAGENSTTERLMAAQRATRAYVARFVRDPITVLRESANAIFNGLKNAAMESYGCEQWQDPRRPYVSRCVRPMTNWNCASCQQKFQVFCGIAGMAIGEIPAALLTGGAAGIASRIANAAKAAIRAGARSGRVSTGVAELLGRFRPPAGLSARVEAIGARTARVMTAAEKRVLERWATMKRSQLSQQVARAAQSVPGTVIRQVGGFPLRMAGFYADAIESAARMGFKAGDEAVASVIGNSERALVREAATTERVRGSLSEVEVPSEARAVTEVTADDLRALAGDTVNIPDVTDDIVDSTRVATTTTNTPGITVSDAVTVVRRDSPVSASGVPITRTNPIMAPSPEPARAPAAITAAARNPEDVLSSSFTGFKNDLDDREIAIDILLGGNKRDEYFGGSARSPEFRDRYEQMEREFNGLDPAARERARSDFARGADEVVAGGNERAAREIEELAESNRIRTEAIDCNAMNRLYPGSFPGRGGECKRVKFDDDVNGKYCACGAASKDAYNFLTRCPRSSAEFHTVFGFANGVALPSTSLPQTCTRVNIPRGKECYFGSTSATYAGLGGLTQMLCLDEASARLRASAGTAVEDFSIQIGIPRIQPVRWSPFSDFDELQAIIERASTACPTTCETSVFRNLNRDYETALERLRTRTTDPTRISRLRQETETFQLYMQGLRDGRLPTPILSRAAGLTDTERLADARRILRRPQDNPITSAQNDAIIRAHNVGGRGSGYFNYSRTEIAEKNRILREAGLNPDEVRRLMRNGIVGGRSEIIDAEEAFQDARRAAMTAGEQRGRLRDGGQFTLDQVRENFRTGAQGFEAEARRTNTPSFAQEAWLNYARSGDRQNTLRMLQSGVSDYRMNPRLVIEGADKYLGKLNQRIAATNPPNPGLIVERDTLKAARDEAARRWASPAPAPSPTPVRTQAQAPTPQARVPAVSEKPASQPASQPAAQERQANSYSPREAQALANEYRLGSGGKPRDPNRAAELYYRAADDLIRREGHRTRGYNYIESKFMDDRNFYEAFNQSLEGNGELAIRMLEDIRTSGGETRRAAAMNSFLYENRDRFNSRYPNPVARENLRKLFQHIEQNYRSDITMDNYWRSWRSAQSE